MLKLQCWNRGNKRSTIYIYSLIPFLRQQLESVTSMMNMVTTMVECDSLQHQTESKFHFLLYSNLQLLFAQPLSPLVDMYVIFV